jgi:hypothetical protein
VARLLRNNSFVVDNSLFHCSFLPDDLLALHFARESSAGRGMLGSTKPETEKPEH